MIGRSSSPCAPQQTPAVVVPQGSPAWITPELVARTLQVWQPYYKQPLSPQDAVTMILDVSRLFDVLAQRERSRETVRRIGPGQ